MPVAWNHLMWACGRVDGLCVDGLCLLKIVLNSSSQTKQALQSSGKSPNAQPRCLQTVKKSSVAQYIKEWSRGEQSGVEQHFEHISGG